MELKQFEPLYPADSYQEEIAQIFSHLKKVIPASSQLGQGVLAYGEAVRNLPEGYKKQHSEIAWNRVMTTRNILIHHYFGINFKTV